MYDDSTGRRRLETILSFPCADPLAALSSEESADNMEDSMD